MKIMHSGRRLLFKVEKKDIGLFTSILSAYEGFGILRTVDPKQGIIEILTTIDFEQDVRDLTEALNNEGLKNSYLGAEEEIPRQLHNLSLIQQEHHHGSC